MVTLVYYSASSDGSVIVGYSDSTDGRRAVKYVDGGDQQVYNRRFIASLTMLR